MLQNYQKLNGICHSKSTSYTHTSASENLGAVSDEQCIQCHQDIAKMKHCSKEDRSQLCWGISAGFSVGKVELTIKERSNRNITCQLLGSSFSYGISTA